MATWLDLERIGPYFALETGAVTALTGWRSLADLKVQDAPLRARVATAHASISAGADGVPERVAASAVQLGLTARLVSPALAGAVLAALVPDLSAHRTWWSASDTDAAPFAVPHLDVGEVVGVEETVQTLLGLVLRGSVATLLRATLDVAGVAEQILWGNVASALAGAGTVIGAFRPELEDRCRDIVSALVATPLLAGTGGYDRREFRRSTCCLFYLAPGGGLCRDCVLAVRRSGQA
ncbi:MAG: (2Fe-2S)-binding protein [Actinomycetota bacterium]|nr:(2Fe-2S)-binding protein [Actinomycetota bacterium]